MTEDSGDILKDVPDEDLPRLAEIYEEYMESVPYAYSTIITAIKSKKRCKKTYLYVMSPNSCWKQDGTFFAYLQECGVLFIFSLDKTGKTIYKALKETKRLNGIRTFFCIHETLWPTIKQYIEDTKLKTRLKLNYAFSISRHDALKYTIECPPSVYIKKLDVTHSIEINDLWPHKNENSKKFITALLEMNDGYGVFLKSNDELVSWVLLSTMGQLAILQTKEEHKKKGYGILVTKYMSRELAKMGYNPVGTILLDNEASISMFNKLGFKNVGLTFYVDLE